MQEQGLDPDGKMSFPVRPGLRGSLGETVVWATQSPSRCEPNASQHGVKAAGQGRVGRPREDVGTWGREPSETRSVLPRAQSPHAGGLCFHGGNWRCVCKAQACSGDAIGSACG